MMTTIQVSRGVSVKADVHVPSATVAVARGGELAGRVVAREFLLEDGEGKVDSPADSPADSGVVVFTWLCWWFVGREGKGKLTVLLTVLLLVLSVVSVAGVLLRCWCLVGDVGRMRHTTWGGSSGNPSR